MGELSDAPLSCSHSFVLSRFRQCVMSGGMSSDYGVSVSKHHCLPGSHAKRKMAGFVFIIEV